MSTNYYYSPDRETVKGPHALTVIQALLEAGEIPANTQVCMEGTNSWEPLVATQQTQLPGGQTPKWHESFSQKLHELLEDIQGGIDVYAEGDVPLHQFGEAFRWAQRLERIDDLGILLVDNSVTGLAGNGLLLCRQTALWKCQVEKPDWMPYSQMRKVRFKAGLLSHKIIINDGEKLIELVGNVDAVRALSKMIHFLSRRSTLTLLSHQIWDENGQPSHR